MEVTIKDVSELPARTQICVRYGDMRRLAPFRAGEKIGFPTDIPAERMPKYYTVDVLRKVGSAKVSLAGIQALGGTITNEKLEIESLDIGSPPVTVSLEAQLGEAQQMKGIADSKKQQVAIRAKQYLEKHGVQTVLHEMFTQLLERLPADPLAFMADFLDKQRDVLEEGVVPRDFSLEPGLGDRPLPGFADGKSPEDLPNLGYHHSHMADLLRKDYSVYENLRYLTTDLGVTLAQCIKPGVDCPGHDLVKVAGVYAGDAECYEKFRLLFDPVICKLHGAEANRVHPTDSSPSKLSTARIDPTGQYAVFASVETRRNFENLRLPTCCSKEERREVERIATNALLSLDGDLKGVYLPMRGSSSFSQKAGGMELHQEEQLRKAGMLFAEPDSRIRLSAGLGRQWPDARGIYMGEMQSFSAWINEEDHLRFSARQQSDIDLKALWARVYKAVCSVEKAAQEEGHSYCHNPRLGYITSCPSRLGTSLRVSVSLRVPHLAAAVDLFALCRSMQLQCGEEVGTLHGSLWTVTNMDSLGVSEVDIINTVIMGCTTIIGLEQRLEKGEPIFSGMPGLGEEPIPGFSATRCPVRLPDLSCHNNLMAEVFQADRDLYPQLRKLKTDSGIGLAQCIKPGIDDRGHPSDALPAGIIAASKECYDSFAPLFDPIVSRLHGVESPPRICEVSDVELSTTHLEALSVRVEIRRNFAGVSLLPSATQTDRREVERLLMKGMLSLNECSGDYLPLAWSDSYMPKPGGMTQSEQDRLRSEGLLFTEPTTGFRLSAGFGRGWPDARGVYITDQRDLCVWCNEEDHLRFIAVQEGGDVQAAFRRASLSATRLEKVLLEQGADDKFSGFARHPRLGVVTTCPEHLGAGISATVSLAVTQLGTKADFQNLCEALELRAHWHSGVCEITSSCSGLKMTEVAIVNSVISGASHLVRLEHKLQKGQSVDDDVKKLLTAAK